MSNLWAFLSTATRTDSQDQTSVGMQPRNEQAEPEEGPANPGKDTTDQKNKKQDAKWSEEDVTKMLKWIYGPVDDGDSVTHYEALAKNQRHTIIKVSYW